MKQLFIFFFFLTNSIIGFCQIKEYDELNIIDLGNHERIDFSFLKDVLSDKRIVWLGEGTHGDGTARLLKYDIIKFLHEKMDFDIYVSEYDFYSTEVSWRDFIKGNDSLVGSYSGAVSMNRLSMDTSCYLIAKYIQDQAFTGDTLFLKGIDVSPTGNNSFYLPREIETIYHEYRDSVKTRLPFYDDPDYWNKHFISQSTFWIAEEGRIIDFLEEVGTICPGKKNEIEFLVQAVISKTTHSAHYESHLGGKRQKINAQYYKLRDEGMVKNLTWILEKNPESKIVISTSSYHMLRRTTELSCKDIKPSQFVASMATLLSPKYKDEIYSIAFLKGKGISGRSGYFYPIKNRRKNDLESFLMKKGMSFSFIDLRAYHFSFFMNVNDGIRSKEIWSNHVDGVIFIKEMKPEERMIFRDGSHGYQPYKYYFPVRVSE